MKLWKKILIAIIVLSAIGIGLIGFGIFEAHEAYKNKIEPDMKRYVTMTQQEQDEYVLSKLLPSGRLALSGDAPSARSSSRTAMTLKPHSRHRTRKSMQQKLWTSMLKANISKRK